MAKILYKEECDGQNKLSCIEGIEIELLNGQKALIYPKYAEMQMLKPEQISKWNATNKTEIEALKIEETNGKTFELRKIESPAAEWVSQFWHGKYGVFCLPSLLAAMEIQYQKVEIDTLAETIEDADLLRDFTSYVWSCSRSSAFGCWFSDNNAGYAGGTYLNSFCLTVPTILYR